MTGPDLVHQLRTLAELHSAGAITAEEFTRAKARLLNPPRPARIAESAAEEWPTAGPPMASAASVDPPAVVSAGGPPTGPDATVAQASASGAAAPGPPEQPPQANREPIPNPLPPFGRGIPGSPVQRPRTPGTPPRTKAFVVAGGGLLALLAFFALPLASLPFLGSLTGANVAGLSSEVGGLGLLWLVPLAAAAVTGLGAWLSFAPGPPPDLYRRVSGLVVLAASGGVLVYLIALIVVQSELSGSGASQYGVSATSVIGAGFWIAVLALAVSGVFAVLGREVSSDGNASGAGKL